MEIAIPRNGEQRNKIGIPIPFQWSIVHTKRALNVA